MLSWQKSAAAAIARCWARTSASECFKTSQSSMHFTKSACGSRNVSRRSGSWYHAGHPSSPPTQTQKWRQGRLLRSTEANNTLSSFVCLRKVQYSSSAEDAARRVKQRNRNTAVYMVAVVAGMIGFTYFSVPLYRIFCAATGYGGTVAEGKTVEAKLQKRRENPDVQTERAAANRMVTVNFVSEVQPGLKWSFTPCQKSIKVRPGQSTLVFYTAENTSDDHLTAVSTYNVAPPQVGRYFNKIQCFCFEEQHLRPRESVDMPVFFYIDPEFATDYRLKNVDHITLSYVFFRTGEVPTHSDGTALTPGESMPAHLLPSQQAIRAGMTETAVKLAEQEAIEAKAATKSCVEVGNAKNPPAAAAGDSVSSASSDSVEPKVA